MPSQVLSSVENNFTKGLVTEFTGLNFPENAAIESDNTEYTIVGDTIRRMGIDYEENFDIWSIDRTNRAVNTYKWNNAGGDGSTQVIAVQVGNTVNFWRSSSATASAPLSNQILVSTVVLSNFTASGGSFDSTLECQFTDGNGYLFIFHPSCDPIYCTYVAGTITGNAITVQIRDFNGIPDNLAVNARPPMLSAEHQYNIINQGWVKGAPWSATSTTSNVNSLGIRNFTVAAGLSVTIGDVVSCYAPFGPNTVLIMWGPVTGYSGTTLTLNIIAVNPTYGSGSYTPWTLIPTQTGYVDTFKSATGSYPSNADVWWYFKNSVGVFDPATQINNVTLSSGRAPQGHFILSAFQQARSGTSGIAGLTDITTTQRPTNGTWFQGRVWYTGLNASQAATGDAPYYTWTENIYFSQIVKNIEDFGQCYSENDPTSETLFDLLPTDGGVIVIQGSGPIYKLFPIQNGMLVFAANGIWFITGSQGIGFSASDYTINKISNVQSISCTSYVNVQGLPYFWNEEGIYTIQPGKGGGMEVEPITVGTILSFYASIPVSSKKYVRGDYHPIDYVIQWIYRDTVAATTTEQYTFNKILNYNTYNKAFFPYTVQGTHVTINGINYVSSPGGSDASEPTFKYLSTNLSPAGLSFSDEHDSNYVDWASDDGGTDYESYFVTGYKLHAQGQRRFQIPYIYVYSRTDTPVAYKIQGLWDYATSGNTGRWSTAQIYNIDGTDYSVVQRRIRIRGQGLVLQLKFKSVSGEPFDFIGWSTFETQNTGV